MILDSGFDPIVFVGWDACLGDAMLNEEEIEEIRNGSDIGRFCIDSNRALLELNRQRFGMNCLDMADPAAMAAALCPECIETCDKYYCEVDITKGPSYGAVLIDYYRFSKKKENAWICSKLDPVIYKKYLISHLKAD